jgi:hypothetical protein
MKLESRSLFSSELCFNFEITVDAIFSEGAG